MPPRTRGGREEMNFSCPSNAMRRFPRWARPVARRSAFSQFNRVFLPARSCSFNSKARASPECRTPSACSLENLERIDLQAKLFDGFRRCRAGHDQILKIVDLVLPVLVQVLQDFVVHRHGAETGRPALSGELGFGKFAFESFTAPLEGSMDRSRRGRQPALQDLQGEADIVLFPAVAVREPRDAVHLGSDIVGDGGVERGFLGR